MRSFNSTWAGGGRNLPDKIWKGNCVKNIIHNMHVFWLTFSFQVWTMCLYTFFAKKTYHGGSRGALKKFSAIFGVMKIAILAPRPLKTSPNQKVMKIKVVHIDETYLKYGLRIILGPLCQPTEPKNLFWAFFQFRQFLASHAFLIMHYHACMHVPQFIFYLK